jgi:hypothetical protein
MRRRKRKRPHLLHLLPHLHHPSKLLHPLRPLPLPQVRLLTLILTALEFKKPHFENRK